MKPNLIAILAGLTILFAIPGAHAASLLDDYTVVKLEYGENRVDFNNDGVPDLVVVGHRENFNAHDYDVISFYANEPRESVLDRLWSETLIFTFPNGHISNKAQRLAAQKPSADPNQLTNRNEEVTVHLYVNGAVVTVRSRWVDKAGTQQGDPYQATQVWVKQHARWQLVAAHVSQVKS